jgi:hypothetical protein
MNYRSVMVFGRARLVVEPDEAMLALDAIVDHVLPGRSAEIRRPTRRELAATKVVALPIDAASAKVRTGHPYDDRADLDSSVWAGTVPLQIVAGAPLPAPNVPEGVGVPASVRALTSLFPPTVI